MSTTAATALQNPFPGLRPFQQGEEHLFFGRESQVDRMVDRLAASRFLSVVGTSGTGKSSLVNCGLLPALHRGLMATAGSSWCVVNLRPGGNPLRSMAQAFARAKRFVANIPQVSMPLADIVDATLNISSLGIAELYEFARFAPGTNLLVYVDQFEELFRYQKTADGTDLAVEVSGNAVAFVNLLLEARAQTSYPIYIVITMRSDFLGECSHFDRLPEVMNEGQYLVPRLTREERRQAIAGPIAVFGAELSPVLLTRLVNDVGDNPDQLSIMQHAINRTWAYWQQEGHFQGALSLEHYENDKVGTMVRALDLHANKAYDELKTKRAKKICEKVFKALTDKGTDPRGIRRPLRLARLCEIVGESTEEIMPVLNVFREPGRSFLMPPAEDVVDEKTVIDISHEILMRVWLRLKQWADEEAQSAATYRHIAETAERYKLGKAGLWDDIASPDLRTALEWKARQQPNEPWSTLYRPGYLTALEFLDQSKSLRDQELAKIEFEHRWRNLSRYLMGFVFVVFMVMSTNIIRWLLKIAPAVTKVFTGSSTALDVLKSINPSYSKAAVDIKAADISLIAIIVFGFLLFAVICVLGYAGLAVAGKHLYRRFAFAAVLQEVSAAVAFADEDLGDLLIQGDVQTGSEVDVTPAVPASFWRILVAGLIDFAVWVLVAGLSIFAIIVISLQLQHNDDINSLLISAAWVPISACLYGCLYPLLMTWSRFGGTLGELALGIRLTDKAGRKPGFWRTFARYAATFPSWAMSGLGLLLYIVVTWTSPWPLLLFAVSGLSFLLQLYPPQHRSLHDRIAGTTMVRKKSKPKRYLGIAYHRQ